MEEELLQSCRWDNEADAHIRPREAFTNKDALHSLFFQEDSSGDLCFMRKETGVSTPWDSQLGSSITFLVTLSSPPSSLPHRSSHAFHTSPSSRPDTSPPGPSSGSSGLVFHAPLHRSPPSCGWKGSHELEFFLTEEEEIVHEVPCNRERESHLQVPLSVSTLTSKGPVETAASVSGDQQEWDLFLKHKALLLSSISLTSPFSSFSLPWNVASEDNLPHTGDFPRCSSSFLGAPPLFLDPHRGDVSDSFRARLHSPRRSGGSFSSSSWVSISFHITIRAKSENADNHSQVWNMCIQRMDPCQKVPDGNKRELYLNVPLLSPGSGTQEECPPKFRGPQTPPSFGFSQGPSPPPIPSSHSWNLNVKDEVAYLGVPSYRKKQDLIHVSHPPTSCLPFLPSPPQFSDTQKGSKSPSQSPQQPRPRKKIWRVHCIPSPFFCSKCHLDLKVETTII
mmetsp:Transcript_23942/g.60615  ORF Transcript_23942/g.60615 Transcript_23942/m.60615 type:complete len:450 (-) Transcript_23942:2793-4142(-)